MGNLLKKERSCQSKVKSDGQLPLRKDALRQSHFFSLSRRAVWQESQTVDNPTQERSGPRFALFSGILSA